ncbi:Hypothetical protein FKW44_006916 [Caligus rogercresseyi]|uniref:Uncharacterized protein n=1 Tax=Caligus rogercresseyi TaxID=217165 RepID=A0A7T8QT56_CALRO|nr:Hypothetical protein FKW44_006916 [Caligus rogercresseyi]
MEEVMVGGALPEDKEYNSSHEDENGKSYNGDEGWEVLNQRRGKEIPLTKTKDRTPFGWDSFNEDEGREFGAFLEGR